MKPHIHAKNSTKKYGGVIEDYQAVHDFIDSSKVAVPDVRHRSMLHSAWGIYLAERVFGIVIVNSEGRSVSVRDIAEDHVIEDLGFIPTMQDYLQHMTLEPWMGGRRRKRSSVVVD
jgi:hypothetical protein